MYHSHGDLTEYTDSSEIPNNYHNTMHFKHLIGTIHALEVLTLSHPQVRSAGVQITAMCVSDKYNSDCLVSIAQLAATKLTTHLATFSNATNFVLYNSLKHWLFLK